MSCISEARIKMNQPQLPKNVSSFFFFLLFSLSLISISIKDPSPPNKVPPAERNAFNIFVLHLAHVRSGSKKDRRITRTTLERFYMLDYLPFAKEGKWPKRSFSLVKRWLKELDIKKARFDKYRCEICFEGRGAEGRIKIGKPNEGDQEKLKKYKDHQSQYENQFEKVKTDKKIERDDTIFYL